jgi:hypothetical protein
VLLIGATRDYSSSHPDEPLTFVFLSVALLVSSFVEVRLERGRLTLSILPVGVAALLLNPLDAAMVGLAVAPAMVRRGTWTILGNTLVAAATACVGAVVASQLHGHESLTLGARLIVLVVVTVGSWTLVAALLSVRTGESISSIGRHNFTASFYLAF